MGRGGEQLKIGSLLGDRNQSRRTYVCSTCTYAGNDAGCRGRVGARPGRHRPVGRAGRRTGIGRRQTGNGGERVRRDGREAAVRRHHRDRHYRVADQLRPLVRLQRAGSAQRGGAGIRAARRSELGVQGRRRRPTVALYQPSRNDRRAGRELGGVSRSQDLHVPHPPRHLLAGQGRGGRPRVRRPRRPVHLPAQLGSGRVQREGRRPGVVEDGTDPVRVDRSPRPMDLRDQDAHPGARHPGPDPVRQPVPELHGGPGSDPRARRHERLAERRRHRPVHAHRLRSRFVGHLHAQPQLLERRPAASRQPAPVRRRGQVLRDPGAGGAGGGVPQRARGAAGHVLEFAHLRAAPDTRSDQPRAGGGDDSRRAVHHLHVSPRPAAVRQQERAHRHAEVDRRRAAQ